MGNSATHSVFTWFKNSLRSQHFGSLCIDSRATFSRSLFVGEKSASKKVSSTFLNQIVRNSLIIQRNWGTRQLAQLFSEISNICLVIIIHQDLCISESFFGSALKIDFEVITLHAIPTFVTFWEIIDYNWVPNSAGTFYQLISSNRCPACGAIIEQLYRIIEVIIQKIACGAIIANL